MRSVRHRERRPHSSRRCQVQLTVTTNGFGVVFSGVDSDGHRWLPLSNVAAQPIVYVRPTFLRPSGAARRTLPVPSPDTLWVGTPGAVTMTFSVTWPSLSPGSENSDASMATRSVPGG